jgi:phage shock protein C
MKMNHLIDHYFLGKHLVTGVNKMSTTSKILYRSQTNRQVAGICGGLGEFLGIDPTIVRLLFVFGVIFGYGFLLLVYFVMFIVVPEEPLAVAASATPML